MRTVDCLPGIGLDYLGPDLDDPTAQLRAWQLSSFMRHEVHGPVYEEKFGLTFIDPDPPSGTAGDIPWRIESMRQNHTVQPDGSYREYIVAWELDERGRIPEKPLAIAGLLVATKPQGLCDRKNHQPTHIAEIDVARRMYGTKLAPHLLAMMRETHAEDPRVDLEVYEHNGRSKRFHGKLGFVVDDTIEPRDGDVYEGKWITMTTTGQVFSNRLSTLITS